MLLLLSRSVMSDSVQPHRWQPTRLPLGFSRQEYWSGLLFPYPLCSNSPAQKLSLQSSVVSVIYQMELTIIQRTLHPQVNPHLSSQNLKGNPEKGPRGTLSCFGRRETFIDYMTRHSHFTETSREVSVKEVPPNFLKEAIPRVT